MTAVMSFALLCLLLVCGKVLRVYVPLLQRLYLPSSVIGGVLGLILIRCCGDWLPAAWIAPWNEVPGFLINVVFASLFLGVAVPGIGRIWRIAAPQFCYGQIIAWGQYVVGLGVVLLLLKPLFGVHEVFGTLLEIGFEGGHGTVGGLASTFEALGFPEGRDLGYTVATVGMITGVVCGMILINYAVLRGWVKGIRSFRDQTRAERCGIWPKNQQPPAGRQTVQADSIDSLAFHVAILGLAVLAGYLFKQVFIGLNQVVPDAIRNLRVLESFPLFPLCMLGGLLLQVVMSRLRIDFLVDHGQMQRISGATLDFLVVAAVASIRLEFVLDYFWPLLIMFVFGILWNLFGVLVLAPRLLPETWFEQSIAEFGQSTGVTATGLLLLRTVDPESKTIAPQAFGYKQLLHEPIMGGGLWTSTALVLVANHGALPIWLISAGVIIFWLFFWRFLVKPLMH